MQVWDPRTAMLRRLGIAAAASEVVALAVSGLIYLGSRIASPGHAYALAELTFLEAMQIGWAVFFLLFIPACLLYVRRNPTEMDGDRRVTIAGARLDGRRASLLRARSRRR